jgi:hypothetical protein
MATSILYFLAVLVVSRKWLPWRLRITAIARTLLAAAVAGGLSLLLKSQLPGTGIPETAAVLLLYGLVYVAALHLIGEYRISEMLSLVRGRSGKQDGRRHG